MYDEPDTVFRLPVTTLITKQVFQSIFITQNSVRQQTVCVFIRRLNSCNSVSAAAFPSKCVRPNDKISHKAEIFLCGHLNIVVIVLYTAVLAIVQDMFQIVLQSMYGHQ